MILLWTMTNQPTLLSYLFSCRYQYAEAISLAMVSRSNRSLSLSTLSRRKPSILRNLLSISFQCFILSFKVSYRRSITMKNPGLNIGPEAIPLILTEESKIRMNARDIEISPGYYMTRSLPIFGCHNVDNNFASMARSIIPLARSRSQRSRCRRFSAYRASPFRRA